MLDEGKILSLFAFEYKLKFSEIEKALGTRSNKLAYYLKNLVKKQLLDKQGNCYRLSESAEYLIPYLSEKNSVLSVLLVHLGNRKSCFLHLRQKRPFKDKLSLPGGRILTGESIKQATKRLMKEKFNISAELGKINSLSLEHLKKNKKILYTYILIFVNAKTKDKINLTNIEKNKKKIITSDYLLLKRDIDKKIDIKTINTLKI